MNNGNRKFTIAGSPEEPIRYVGGTTSNDLYHDGRIRPAIGVQSYQAFRSNREMPETADDLGWTYVNQQYMTWWNGAYFIQYIANYVGEHEEGGQTLLMTSQDGKNWSKPVVVFPAYRLPDGTDAVMHHRMGFYTTSEDRLLVLGFYGTFPVPNNGKGIGRVVREIYRDGSFGPIYFIRCNTHMGWNESNTLYPLFTQSQDEGFLKSCRELLSDKLVTLQWWEEEQVNDRFFSMQGGKAMSYFRRKDGKIVGVWKGAGAAISEDDGKTWSPMVPCRSIITNGAKAWLQETSDGKYAMVYNPTHHNENRWPMAVTTSEDGIVFDHMLTVESEVPPVRYQGNCKTPGLQYVRGIEQLLEKGPRATGTDMWLCQAMNKEDVWVHRVPVPIRERVDDPVYDTFEQMEAGGVVTDWNIYSGQWAKVNVVEFPGSVNKCLELRDRDPYDYARAFRVFRVSRKADIRFKLYAAQERWGWMEIDVSNAWGGRPVRITLDNKGLILIGDGPFQTVAAKYEKDRWYAFHLQIDVVASKWNLLLDGKEVWMGAALAEPVDSVERLSFRTGAYRTKTGPEETHTHHIFHYDSKDPQCMVFREDIRRHKPDLPNAGIPEKEAVYCLDDVQIDGYSE